MLFKNLLKLPTLKIVKEITVCEIIWNFLERAFRVKMIKKAQLNY